MRELENNLIHLYQSFFADTPYQETLRMSLKAENSSRLPE